MFIARLIEPTIDLFFMDVVFQVACYTEIKRVMKPGQLFAGYEWCITDAYNPENKDHKRIKVTASSEKLPYRDTQSAQLKLLVLLTLCVCDNSD